MSVVVLVVFAAGSAFLGGVVVGVIARDQAGEDPAREAVRRYLAVEAGIRYDRLDLVGRREVARLVDAARANGARDAIGGPR